ncbi:MAG TPA: pirin family protein [Acidobacteriota bacterium]|nr:pirin family protein [Acidobacteriota bacterium]
MKTDFPSNQPGQLPSALETLIVTRVRDLVDGFKVRRVLPTAKRRMVGPFTFLDQMGPEVFTPGQGLDVGVHPHIGLATVTYLFTGELLHRDSLGTVQPIRPGEVNWMTAGKGIAHSERTPPELRQTGADLFGVQAWVALPARYEEMSPEFCHYGGDELPILEGEGKFVRLISGALYGKRSPVQTLSDMFYADVTLDPGAELQIPGEYEERASYLVQGSVTLLPDGISFEAGQLLVFKPGEEIRLRGSEVGSTRMMLLGGEPMDGPRYIWWNFVSSSKDLIEQAKADWKAGKFAPVLGESDVIPLPYY